MKETKYYNAKITHGKVITEIRVYDSIKQSGYKIVNRRRVPRKNTKASRIRSNQRAKMRILSLIPENFTDHNLCFITLTFKENLQLPKVANKALTSFIRKLRRAPELTNDLRYIAVPEVQKRGAIHFHIVTNISDYIPYENLVKYWTRSIDQNSEILEKGGYIKIKRYEGRNVQDIAVYLSKYLTKSGNFTEIFNGQKIYMTSRNLKRPAVSTLMVNSPSTLAYLPELAHKKLIAESSYLNPYTQKAIHYYKYQ